MKHRTLPALARSPRAAAALLFAAAMTAGCDNKGATGAAPDTRPAASTGTGGSAGSVGVLDPRRVLEALQWDAEQKRDFEGAKADVDRELAAALQQLSAVVEQKRKTLIAAGKLTTDQIDKLNRVEVDTLPLSKEQKVEYQMVIQNAVQYEQQARALHQRTLGERQQAVERMYTEAVRPAVRRAALASGLQVVMLKQTVFYSEPAIELTDKVIDELQKAPPPKNFPPLPKLNLPQVRLDEPPKMTTQPATGPANATTAPTQPAR